MRIEGARFLTLSLGSTTGTFPSAEHNSQRRAPGTTNTSHLVPLDSPHESVSVFLVDASCELSDVAQAAHSTQRDRENATATHICSLTAESTLVEIFPSW